MWLLLNAIYITNLNIIFSDILIYDGLKFPVVPVPYCSSDGGDGLDGGVDFPDIYFEDFCRNACH
jgi:hypothetical protein